MQFVLIAILVLALAAGLMLFMKKKQRAMMKTPEQPMQQPKAPQQPPQNTPQ